MAKYKKRRKKRTAVDVVCSGEIKSNCFDQTTLIPFGHFRAFAVRKIRAITPYTSFDDN